ncbi:hypothetical protein KP509_07G059000 [Ceratopteris richardii]|nr:hypothetical protein KP509_07G059000 [Ceratopteris richardii]
MIINRISTSGAVQLATLEGDVLPNYISGCRVKLYQEPLTEEMLMRLNTAKKRKEEELRVREEAQAEARERIRRNKLRRLGLEVNTKAPKYHMDMCQKSDLTASQIIDRRPFVTIAVGQGKNAKTVRALIDSGAETSAVRLSYCQDLQLDIKPIEAYLIGLGGVETPCLGEVELPIYLQDVLIKVKMLVCHDADLTEPLVLGQDWIYDHAVNLNLRSQLLQVWVHEQCITLELDKCMLTNQEVTHSLSSPETNLRKENFVCVTDPMTHKDSIMKAKAQRPAHLSSSSHTNASVTQPRRQAKMTSAISTRQMEFTKKEAPGMKQIWVQKGEQPPALPQPIPSKQAKHAKRSTQKRGQAQSQGLQQVWVPKQLMTADHHHMQIWVPKKLATAQQGRSQMWVHKQLLQTQRPMLPTMQKVSKTKPRREKGKNIAQRPKEDKTNPSAKVSRQSLRIWVWKPKAPATSTEPMNQPHWIPNFGKHPKMKWPEVISTGPNPILKWVPIRRITSFRDPIDTSKQKLHQV